MLGLLRGVVVAVLLFLSVVVPMFLIDRVADQTITSLVWVGGVSAFVGVFALAMLLLR